VLPSVLATIAALASTAALDNPGGPGGKAINQISSDLARLIQEYGPQILGTLAGLGILGACEALTAGTATSACSGLGGATSSGISYTLSATQDGTFTGHGLLAAALNGGAEWTAGGILGDILAPPQKKIRRCRAP
jgi:hypothetical protein